MTGCGHPGGRYLYAATDGDGNEVGVYRCDECGDKYIEGL